MKKILLNTKERVGYQLLRVVFSLYLIVAVGTTLVHLLQEYYFTKQSIDVDLEHKERSFKNQISNTVWNLDSDQLKATVMGILEDRFVVGVSIRSIDNKKIVQVGIVESAHKTLKDSYFVLKFKKEQVSYEDGLYSHTFAISHKEGRNEEVLGFVSIYSNQGVIINEVKNNFFFIVLNSIIKTIALWLIFLYFAKKMLTQPLSAITTVAQNINEDNFRTLRVDSSKQKKNELKVLALAFNEMLDKLEYMYQDLQMQKSLVEASHENLENIVRDRTFALQKSNSDLEETIKTLKTAQEQLVETEKMASLGGLVAGVAHEVNTPLGLGLTGITHFNDITKILVKKYQNDALHEEDFEEYLETSQELAKTILANISRATELINSFKQVSVDQTSEELREFNVKEYTDEILTSLKNRLKKTNIKVKNEIEEEIIIKSFPGAYAQVITNLIMNSLVHAYDKESTGFITLKGFRQAGSIVLVYSDDGKGIDKESLKHIFEPFYTTNRSKGGSGLGLHIVYNLITTMFCGSITCTSNLGEGVVFKMILQEMQESSQGDVIIPDAIKKVTHDN